MDMSCIIQKACEVYKYSRLQFRVNMSVNCFLYYIIVANKNIVADINDIADVADINIIANNSCRQFRVETQRTWAIHYKLYHVCRSKYFNICA